MVNMKSITNKIKMILGFKTQLLLPMGAYQMMSGRRRMKCSVKTCSPVVMRSVPCSLD